MATVKRRWSGSPSPAASSSRDPVSTPPSSSRDPVATSSSLHFPPELIPAIGSRLTSLQDFFALRAACRAYRALLPLTPSNLASQAPLLLVPHADAASRALFHLPLRRRLRFRVPVPRANEDIIGCRLAICNSIDPLGRRELRIVHLLTGEEVRLPSPPDRLFSVLLFDDHVVAWNWKCRNIQYCRLGAPDWRLASISKPNRFESLIFVKDTLYALVKPGYRLAVVELSDKNSYLELAFLGGQFRKPEHKARVLCLADCCGELLLVTIVVDGFSVFKWQSGEGKWTRIPSLGGCTLFLAGHCFAGCLGPDHRGIRGDCIYYAAAASVWYEYSLTDGSFKKCVAEYQGGGARSAFRAPAWVFPSMC